MTINLGYTATPANANLDAIIATATAERAARITGTITVVASAAERDATFPAPATDQRVEYRDTGDVYKYDGVGWNLSATGVKGSTAFDPRAFGAKWDGTGDDGPFTQLAINAAMALGPGGKVALPSGRPRWATGVTVPYHGIDLIANTNRGLEINYDPAADGTCITVKFTTTTPTIAVSTLKNIRIGSTGTNAKVKIGFQIVDGSEITLDNCSTTFNFLTFGAQTTSPSIGLQLLGRELITLRKCTFFADRPVDVGINPRGTISLDGCHIEDLYTSALASNQPNFNIGSGVGLVANLTWDGTNIFTLGKYGFCWNDTAATQDAQLLRLANFRWEQAADTTGATVYISRNAHVIYQVIIDSMACGTTSTGVYLRGCGNVTWRNSMYGGSSGAKNAFDIDETVTVFDIDNVWMQAGCGFSAVNHTMALSVGRVNNVDTGHPPFATYIAMTGAVVNALVTLGGHLRFGAASKWLLPVGGISLFDNTLSTALGSIGANGRIALTTSSFVEREFPCVYAANIVPDANQGNSFLIIATNGTAFTVAAPVNPLAGQVIEIRIKNTSGGALGVATWNAIYKMTAWVQPANGFSRNIQFRYDGTNWVERVRAAADIPN